MQNEQEKCECTIEFFILIFKLTLITGRWSREVRLSGEVRNS